jgi:hypothetical protein
MGWVLDHVLGHVTGWGLGGHVMWVSQGHVVGDAPSALGYSWALGPGLCYDPGFTVRYFSFFYPIIFPSLAAPVAPSPSLRRPLHDPHFRAVDPFYPRIKGTSFSLDIGLSSYWYTSSPTLFASLVVLYLLHDSIPITL